MYHHIPSGSHAHLFQLHTRITHSENKIARAGGTAEKTSNTGRLDGAQHNILRLLGWKLVFIWEDIGLCLIVGSFSRQM
jgi:hypothetical protein